MSTVTGKQVLSALNLDPVHLEQPESVRQAMAPFILKLPKLLADHLDKVVTVQTLLEARVVFIRYCLKNDFISAVVSATPAESLGVFSVESFTELAQGALENLLPVFEDAVKDIPTFLELQGVTEEELLAHPKGFGLKEELMERYRACNLKIADILKYQPLVIIKNT